VLHLPASKCCVLNLACVEWSFVHGKCCAMVYIALRMSCLAAVSVECSWCWSRCRVHQLCNCAVYYYRCDIVGCVVL
jgi:hypothetical protein